jgi:phage terminase large subunit
MTTKKKVPVRKKPVRKKIGKKKKVSKRVALKPAVVQNMATTAEEARRERLQSLEKYPWPLRPYQETARQQFEKGKRRQGLFWHRRAGKDVFCLSMARNETRKRVGGYVHFFPKHVQAKRAIWNGIDPKKGAKFIDIAFGDQEASRNNTEMMIEMYNASTWQLLGSDNYDRIVGSNIVGAFFSEWALCDPRAWDFIRPMILENDGFVFFITTFRGRNHAWQMSKNLASNPEWHIDVMNVDQSRDVDGKHIITPEQIESERASGMSEALIQQEYYCNPDATSDGAIYGQQVQQLRNDPRRNLGDWNPAKPVYCVWNFDLPIFASFLMIQPGDRPVILDAGILEFTTLGDAIAHVNQRRWPVQQHFVMAHQRDIIAAMYDLNLRPGVLPLRNELTATTCTASFIERMHVDGERCDALIEALAGYVRRERFDPQAAVLQFGPDPVMSWHWRLAYPLESYSAWDYAAVDTWGPSPNYAAQDRAIKTVL